MKSKERRQKLFANKIHRDICMLIFLASVIPAGIIGAGLYYLIFGITAREIGIPEAIAYNIIPASKKVLVILLILAPAAIISLLYIAIKATYRIVGPFERIIRELDAFIEGKKSDLITLRKKDRFAPLVDRINILLQRIKEK